MTRGKLMQLLAVVAIGVVAVVLGGCPRAQEVETEVPPAEGAPAVPTSAATLGEALAAVTFPASYEMTIVEGTAENTEAEPMTFLMKMDGRKLVAYRLNTPDGSMIADVVAGVSYDYDPASKEAFKMALESDDGDIPNPYDFYGDDAKITGSETIDGADCWVVEGPGGGDAPDVMWIDKANGLMRQAKDGEDTVQFKYARIGEIPDSEFELPEGTKVTDLTQAPRDGG